MGVKIHATAIVDPKAQLADGVTVGPFAIIGPNVKVGTGSVIGPRVLLDGHTTLGARNQLYQGVTIGMPPQDLKFKAGTRSYIEIGDENIFREYVTIHLSNHADGVTRIHNQVYLMAYAHVAHDCQVHDGVIMANSVNLAGHVTIERGASLGGGCTAHQFARVGESAFVGGMSAIRMDIIPYVKANGNPCRLYGMNVIGLRRKGFSAETVHGLKRVYKILFRSNLTLPAAIDRARAEVGHLPEVAAVLDFAVASKRGLIRERHGE